MAAVFRHFRMAAKARRRQPALAEGPCHAHNTTMPRRGDQRLRSEAVEPGSPVRPCDAPGCEAVGEFRAPRDRRRLRDYYWFCLPHVREYNAAWDYYRGMSPDEIESHLRDDNGWQRPTWPLGRLGGAGRFDPETLRDPLGLLNGGHRPSPRRARTDEAPPELRAALGVLGLGWPLEQGELRSRYKELAKRHHPDANGGDRASEERLKDINRAYSLLRQRLGASPAVRRAAPAEGAPAG
jgi:hypothetical protein